MKDDNIYLNINFFHNLKKRIDKVWSEGTNEGGFPSGLTLSPNTCYYLFYVLKSNGTEDGGFDSSLTAVNLLADTSKSGYVNCKRINFVITDASSKAIVFDDSRHFLDDKFKIKFSFPVTNTASSTINVNSFGIKNIKKADFITDIDLTKPPKFVDLKSKDFKKFKKKQKMTKINIR